MSNRDIGKRIYERRKQLGLTQEQLSELADSTPQAISNYERGARELKASTIIKIAKALKTSTDYLLTGENETIQLQCDLSGITQEKSRILNEIIQNCLLLID